MESMELLTPSQRSKFLKMKRIGMILCNLLEKSLKLFLGIPSIVTLWDMK